MMPSFVRNQRFLALLSSLAVLGTGASRLRAHCEVPCGIYSDQARFEQMLEDHSTIAKAMAQIEALSEKDDALSHNQLARWVITKESHATNVQHITAQYFLTQRIKADADNYGAQLEAAHAVLVAAMKCKQTVDPAAAEALRTAVLQLYRAYEGREPDLRR